MSIKARLNIYTFCFCSFVVLFWCWKFQRKIPAGNFLCDEIFIEFSLSHILHNEYFWRRRELLKECFCGFSGIFSRKTRKILGKYEKQAVKCETQLKNFCRFLRDSEENPFAGKLERNILENRSRSSSHFDGKIGKVRTISQNDFSF
jgi:hypothetical protein